MQPPFPAPAGVALVPLARPPAGRLERGLPCGLATLCLLLGATIAQADDAALRAVPGTLVTDYHGVQIADPYRALEDLSAPSTQAWARSQAGYARAQLDRLPGLPALRRRIAELDADSLPTISRLQITASGRWFYLERRPGESATRLMVRDSANGPARVLLDTDRWQRATGIAHAIDNYTVSPDGLSVAAVISQADAELGALRVFEVATGRETLPAVPYVWGELAPTWRPDSSALFYAQSGPAYDAVVAGAFSAAAGGRAASGGSGSSGGSGAGSAAPPSAPAPFGRMQLLERRLAGGPDRVIAGAGRTFGPQVGDRDWIYVDTSDPMHVLVVLEQGVSSDIRVYETAADALERDPLQARWTSVVGLDAQGRDWTITGQDLVVRTVKDAPRYRLVRYDLDQPEAAPVDVVAQQRGVIEELQGTADGLYYDVRSGSTSELFFLPTGTHEPRRLTLPFAGAVSLQQGSSRVPGIVYGLQGWTHERQLLRARGSASTVTTLVPAHASQVGADWIAEETTCSSWDGTAVPMSLVYRRGLKKDGSHPVLLDGYGGYGLPVTAVFSPRLGAFYERGGIFAEVDPRGGGAYGFEWYQAGVGPRKSNTWKDMIACGQALVDRGYTTPGRLAIQGTSMGGVAVGRAVTERPDLFGVAIVRVGITEAIRFIEATNNGPNHEDEMGSLATAAGVKQLLAMSTYHQIRDGEKYPAMLFTAGMNDNRVAPWISFKTFARMQAASASGKPVLLRVEDEGGHGVSSTAAQRNAELADRLAFLLWNTGDPAFQPAQ